LDHLVVMPVLLQILPRIEDEMRWRASSERIGIVVFEREWHTFGAYFISLFGSYPRPLLHTDFLSANPKPSFHSGSALNRYSVPSAV